MIKAESYTKLAHKFFLKTSAFFLAMVFPLWTMPAAAEQYNLSQDWLFNKGEIKGAEVSNFDTKGWKKVTVPHDWSIMDKPDDTPPFDSKAIAGQDSGYLPGGIGWYRRDFTISEKEASNVIHLKFEAIYMDAQIWVNGVEIAHHNYGYTAFTIDLTGKVHTGKNIIAIRVNHQDPSSRWYAGSGIIRPVSLEILNCINIAPDTVFVKTPIATTQKGKIIVSSAASNCAKEAQKVDLITQIIAPNGEIVATSSQKSVVSGNSNKPFNGEFDIANPALWSLEAPNLYKLKQQLKINGVVVDERNTRFGLREISFNAEYGLKLNGKKILLRGGNIHHDNYMLGAAGMVDADKRKVGLMKAAGYNAIRSAHNPASQATLDAADELGMLVIDEAFDSWNNSKRHQDYSRFFANDWQKDIDSMVISGRNHPSVLMWSIGNEIPEQGTQEGVKTAQSLKDRIKLLDDTRPVTQAVSVDPPQSDGISSVLDVAGYNYRAHLFPSEHDKYPNRIMYTAESIPQDAFDSWRIVETMPSVIGDFVWTSVDYLGEAGIGWMGYSQDWQKLGPYPWNLAYCGEIDATGRKRSGAYYREVIWKTGIDPISVFVKQPEGTEDLPDRHFFPIVPPHYDWSLEDVHPSWTWKGQEGKPLSVDVYSEYPEVELFLNDKSIGRKKTSVETRYKATYQVNYTPGKLKAIGYDANGEKAGQWELRTANSPKSAKIILDKNIITADGQSLAYVTIELLDDNGTPIYSRSDDRLISVRVTGAGSLAGIGNGDPHDVSSFQNGDRNTFHGRAVAVVKSATTPGQITIEVRVKGQEPQIIHLNAISALLH